MLEHTFVHLTGVGHGTETALWRRGVTNWSEFLSETRIPRISEERKAAMDAAILEGVARLGDSDSRYFGSRLSQRNTWRLLTDFQPRTIFLDIETTGISIRSPVTVVGVYDGRRMHNLVRGRNLTDSNLSSILSSAGLIVTYNGKSFDLPVLRNQFPGAVPEVPHVDLRHLFARLGFCGGLKAIERDLDIQRDRRLEMMTGADAVYLWRLWEKKGSANALDLLLEYNAADCANLKDLARYAYDALRRQTYETVVNRKT
jgi:uncharacterized protein YprB with RNaseH-like and TPR domain